jgi:hypothetical protein
MTQRSPAQIVPSIAIGHIAGRLQELSDATNGNMMSILGPNLGPIIPNTS